jgi:uncharacterized protein DUF4038/uncharacterized protein DUF5060/collagenase-like protein with putative collagen-binding domain
MILLLLFFGTATAWPQTVHRYGRFEQVLTADRDPVDPLEQDQIVEFTGPGGRVHLPAFWDGGRTWKIRFSPEQTGRWTWRAPSGFSPATGSFEAKTYVGSNELYRRGAPRLSANRRHFVHADGKPWFFLSCTGWNSALMSTDEEWQRYIDDRAAKKFTAVQFVMTQWRAGRKDELGQVAFTPSAAGVRVHPEFFRRMDRKFDAINDRGLAAVPVMLWALTSKDQESPGISLSTQDAIKLARYMAARYGAHHVLWFLGGDGNFSGENAPRWKSIGRGVFPEGRRHGPVTLHPGGMRSPWPEYKDEPWVDFFLYQSGHGNDAKKWRWNATQGLAVDWKMEPARPVIDGEPNYEAHLDYHTRQPITDYQVRRAVYYSLLAGPTAGVTYGAHGIWFWSRKAEVPLDHPRTGVAAPWYECLDYPGARQMRVMRDIFDSIEWWKLRPDRSLLAEDTVDEEFRTYVMSSRSEDGRFAVLYVPAGATLKLNLAPLGGRVRATWIDPRSGRREPSSLTVSKPPSTEDWVLILRPLILQKR